MTATIAEQIHYMKELVSLAAECAFVESTAGNVEIVHAPDDGTPWAVVEGEFPVRRGHGTVAVGFRRGILELDVRGENRTGYMEQFPSGTVSPEEFRPVVQECVRYVRGGNGW